MNEQKQLQKIYSAIKKIDRRIDQSREGILTFALPEERNAFEVAVKAMDFALAWNDLHEKIRQTLKYTEHSKEEGNALAMIQTWMSDIAQYRLLPEVE
jgi:hypothetical protein